MSECHLDAHMYVTTCINMIKPTNALTLKLYFYTQFFITLLCYDKLCAKYIILTLAHFLASLCELCINVPI
jgi:hypothetical protein